MSQSRLELLQDFIKRAPKDSFAHFGLAMEYARLGENEKALETFRSLWQMNPNYSAAYFQAGRLLAKLGDTEQARQVLTDGIQAAARTSDLHAKGEMEAELANL